MYSKNLLTKVIINDVIIDIISNIDLIQDKHKLRPCTSEVQRAKCKTSAKLPLKEFAAKTQTHHRILSESPNASGTVNHSNNSSPTPLIAHPP